MKLKIKLLTKSAKMPTYATAGSAAMDLYASEDVRVENGSVCLVPTGLAFEIPEGFVGLIVPRSGLSLKTPLRQPNCVGVIDSDYRGEVRGMFEVNSCSCATIPAGTRFAQMLIVPVWRFEMVQADELSTTYRGEGGFGSTGVK